MANGENIRAGYKATIDLWNTAGNQNWSRFNAMLVANTVVFAVIGQLMARTIVLPIPWVLPIVGLILCASWWVALARGLTYQDLYVALAREMEAKLDPADVVRRGRGLADGGTVAANGQKFKMRHGAQIRTRYAMRAVVIVFAVLYGVSGLLLASDHVTTALRVLRADRIV